MKTKLASIALTSKQIDSSRNAQLFYLNDENDGLNLAKLLDNHQEIKVKDELQAQLIELIKLRYPKEKYSGTPFLPGRVGPKFTSIQPERVGTSIKWGLWGDS